VKKLLFILTILVVSACLFQQCTKKTPQEARRFNTSQADGCLSCHMNADVLKKVATPLPPANTESGEG
jgi:nitrate/TMAO reductase-like tetraheme cytochrome c subunit